jgi:hypothetical protein
MSVLLKPHVNKGNRSKKNNAPKIVLGLGKNLAEIDYDLLFENKSKQ